MTTLTLQQNIGFKKTHFVNIEELRTYINRDVVADADSEDKLALLREGMREYRQKKTKKLQSLRDLRS